MEEKHNVVEYLIITKQEDSFCDSTDAFIRFLSIDSSLEISDKEKSITITITKKQKQEKFTASYLLSSELVPGEKERYFKLILSSEEKGKLSEFTELTNRLENIIQKLHNEVSINVLWNDIARQYAIQGYTLINEVENLLRRLIANFMFTKVGYYWPENHIPKEVASRDENRKLKNNYTNYLYETQFSDLKTILFQGQRDINFRDIGAVQRLIEKYISEGKQEISIENLRGIVSQSLWEKYFSQGVDVKKDALEKDLDELNKLRNEVAHNRHVSRETLGKIEGLSKKVINTLKLAIEELPQKSLTPEEQVFQVITELERIGSSTPSDVLECIANYYNETYEGSTIVTFHNMEDNSMYDIIINANEKTRIAVKVKYYTMHTTKWIGDYIINLRSKKFDSSSFLQEFNQFHLVITFSQPIGSTVFEYISTLNRFTSFYNMDSNIIFGCISQGRFKRIL